MFRLFEDEGKGIVELLVRAQPDEVVLAHVDLGLELCLVDLAGAGIQTVRGDNQVVLCLELGQALFRDVVFEDKVHADLARALLEQQKHLLAPDAAEAVAARGHRLFAADDLDVIPVGEMVTDHLLADRIVAFEIRHCLIRKDHPPAEGVVGAVALVNGNVVRGVAQLHRNCEVEPGGASAQYSDLHDSVSLLGSASEYRIRKVLQD